MSVTDPFDTVRLALVDIMDMPRYSGALAALASIEARVEALTAALRGLTAGLKYLSPEQIAEAPRDATAILDVPCGAVQDAFAALATSEQAGTEEGA